MSGSIFAWFIREVGLLSSILNDPCVSNFLLFLPRASGEKIDLQMSLTQDPYFVLYILTVCYSERDRPRKKCFSIEA